MASASPSLEGKAPSHVASAGKDCFTWYKIFGSLPTKGASSPVPLIGLHGGPGAGHEYLLSMQDLWTEHGIPVVLYDQLGCGRSVQLREKKGDEGFWTEQLFRDEIDNLVKHLGITTFDILGHSWGGMLGAVYAASRPQGLRKLILMGAPASVDLVLQGSAELLGHLPQDVQGTIRKYEKEGNFHDAAYKAACLHFYKRYLCRSDPWPQELVTSMAHLEEDPTVYITIELCCTGNLKSWTAIPYAGKIQQTTLLINGAYDETVEYASAPYFEEIPRVKWVFLPNSSHMGMWEERDRFIKIVADFLALKG